MKFKYKEKVKPKEGFYSNSVGIVDYFWLDTEKKYEWEEVKKTFLGYSWYTKEYKTIYRPVNKYSVKFDDNVNVIFKEDDLILVRKRA